MVVNQNALAGATNVRNSNDPKTKALKSANARNACHLCVELEEAQMQPQASRVGAGATGVVQHINNIISSLRK